MTTLIASIMLTLTSVFHVGELAEYYISQEENMITMMAVLEKDEILNLDFKSDCDVKKTTALCLSNYILKKITVEINNKLLLFELGNSYTEYGHLVLFLTGKFKDENVKSINIRNDCFYEFYEDYRNRIILNIGSFKSSYMLTSEKSSIEVPHKNLNLEIYNLTGQLMLTKVLTNQNSSFPINTNILNSGIYFAVISNDSSTWGQKIIISH